MLLIFGVYCIIRKKILELQFRKNIRAAPGFGIEVEWNFFDHGLTQKSIIGNAEVKWDGVYETVTTPQGFLIYL